MKKLLIYLKTNKFSVGVIFLSLILSILSGYYAWELAKETKEVDVKRSIYQLGVTAIAASVGIGTIINSTRSASIAAESIKVTKEKELREQSSHLIPLSKIGHFPLVAPFYKEDFEYMLDRFDRKVKEKIIEDSEWSALSIENFEYEKNDYLKSFRTNSFTLSNNNVSLKLVNMGKGSCVNLEYAFNFLNIHKFKGYEVMPDYEILPPTTHEYMKPIAYSIKVTDDLELEFNDLYFEKFINQESIEWRIENGSDFNYKMRMLNVTEYESIVKPQGEVDIYIPDDFLMLCRHYMNTKYLDHEKNNSVVKDRIKASYLMDWDKHEPIKPIGELKISFFEENLIRTGEIDPNKRRELTYRVSLKDTETKFTKDGIRYYLEVNLSNSEKTI